MTGRGVVGWGFSAPDEPLPPPQSGCSCQGRRLQLQVRLAGCPPPSRVCLRGRKPAHLWNPSLSPRSASPPVPWERGVSRPRSGALFPAPLRLQCRQCSLGSPCTKLPPVSERHSAFLSPGLSGLLHGASPPPEPRAGEGRAACSPAHLLPQHPRKVPAGRSPVHRPKGQGQGRTLAGEQIDGRGKGAGGGLSATFPHFLHQTTAAICRLR